jgi:hypothetical protein
MVESNPLRRRRSTGPLCAPRTGRAVRAATVHAAIGGATSARLEDGPAAARGGELGAGLLSAGAWSTVRRDEAALRP